MKVIRYCSGRSTGKTIKGLLEFVSHLCKQGQRGLIIYRYRKTKDMARSLFSPEIIKRISFLQYDIETDGSDINKSYLDLSKGSPIFVDDAIDENELGAVLKKIVEILKPEAVILTKSIPQNITVTVRTKEEKEAFEKFLSLTSSKSISHPNFSLSNEYLFNGVPIEIVIGDGLKGFEWLK